MAKKQASFRVDLARARALWCVRQGLASRAGGAGARVVDVVSGTGWVRTLGGVDVYLAVRARCSGLRRADLDRAVARRQLRVIPAARGCIYLVPDHQVAMALSLAAALWRPRTERDLTRAGSSWDEVETLAQVVFETMAGSSAPGDSPTGMTTAGIRKALPDGAVRSLGAAGKKVGLSSPLPVALRVLEFDGRIVRTLEAGQLDTERYLWQIAGDSAERDAIAAHDSNPTARNTAVARHFLSVAGPATLKQFAAWSGLSQRDAGDAVAGAGAVAVDVDGLAGPCWLLEDDVDALQRAAVPESSVALLPFEDNLITIHDGPAVHVDPRYHDLPVDAWGGTSKPVTLGTARHIGHRTVVAGDRVIGFWEFDIASSAVVCAPFAPVTGTLKAALEAECAAISDFLRDDVGHARSFSLDTDAAVQKRASAVQAGAPALGAQPGSRAALDATPAAPPRPAPIRRTGGKKTISRRE